MKATHSKTLTTRRRKQANRKRLAKMARQEKKLGKQNLKAGSASALGAS